MKKLIFTMVVATFVWGAAPDSATAQQAPVTWDWEIEREQLLPKSKQTPSPHPPAFDENFMCEILDMVHPCPEGTTRLENPLYEDQYHIYCQTKMRGLPTGPKPERYICVPLIEQPYIDMDDIEGAV